MCVLECFGCLNAQDGFLVHSGIEGTAKALMSSDTLISPDKMPKDDIANLKHEQNQNMAILEISSTDLHQEFFDVLLDARTSEEDVGDLRINHDIRDKIHLSVSSRFWS